MKVVFINRYFYPDHSATSHLLTDLAFHLAESGSNVCVVTGRQLYDDKQALLPGREAVRKVLVYRVATTRFGRSKLIGRSLDYLTFYLSAVFRLMRLVSRGDIIVAKTDPPLISVVAGMIARLKGARLVNWIQDLFPEVATELNVKGVQGPIACLLRAMRNNVLKRSFLNIPIGQQMAARLIGQGVPARCIRVIPNWSDGQKIRPIEHPQNALRKEWQLDGKFVIGYSGNFGRAHDFSTLLDTAELLKEEKKIIFLLIGDGYRLSWIKSEVEKRRLTNFIFKPYQVYDKLSESLNTADVHIVSLYPELEGLVFPSKFYGIAATGRPMIYVGDPGGEIPDMLLREKMGYVVRIGESRRFADYLMGLMANPVEWIRMGLNARAFFDRSLDRRFRLSEWRNVLCSL